MGISVHGNYSFVVMGIGYAFSIFVVPIEKDLGLTRADTSFVFTLCFVCFAMGSLVTGFLMHKISSALLLKIAACMFCGGYSFKPCDDVMAVIFHL